MKTRDDYGRDFDPGHHSPAPDVDGGWQRIDCGTYDSLRQHATAVIASRTDLYGRNPVLPAGCYTAWADDYGDTPDYPYLATFIPYHDGERSDVCLHWRWDHWR